MLLGTFNTVFNNVLLVPTKPNTPHGQEGEKEHPTDGERRERQREA